MEREELLQQVNESLENDGKKLSSTLSEETINGELDEALEDIGDDEEANRAIVSKLAKRLLRIDGNLHSNVSREVTAYKNAHPKQKPDPKNVEGGGKKPEVGNDAYDKLNSRIEAMEKALKTKADKDAKDATVADVKKGLLAKFKEADIEANPYILKQTLRDLEIPETEDGKEIDVDSLIKTTETAYYKNLKEAGLDKKDTGRSHKGNFYGGKGKSKLDAMFEQKKAKEGWGKKH